MNANKLSAKAPVATVASEPSPRKRKRSTEIQPAKQSKTYGTTLKELQVIKPRPNPKSKSAAKSSDNESSSQSSESQKVAYKELVIDDYEVELLRRFLARRGAWALLERFDNDVEYKSGVFYKLNPLVNLERCGPLEKLLTQKLTLKECARHLGLRSVADVTPEKRFDNDVEYKSGVFYKLNPLVNLERCGPLEKLLTQKLTLKEFARHLGLRSVADVTPEKRSSRSSMLSVKTQIHRPARESLRDTADSDTEVKKLIRSHLERRISARANSVREQERTKQTDEKQRANPAPDQKEKTIDKDEKQKQMRKKDPIVVKSDTDDKRRTTLRNKGTKDDEYVLINDNTQENRLKTRTKANDSGKVPSKSIDPIDTDENSRQYFRTRTKPPNRPTKEHNRANDNNSSKESNKKNKNVDSSTENKNNTRSSMKTAENDSNYAKVKTSSNTENASKRNDGKSRFSRKAKETSENVSVKDLDKSEISNSSEEFETKKEGKDLTKRISAFSMLRSKNANSLKRKQDVDTKKNDQVSEENKHRKGNKKEDIAETDAQKRIDSDKKRSETEKEKSEVLRDKVEKDKEEKKKIGNISKKKTVNKRNENDKKSAVARSMSVKPVKFKK